MAKKQYSGGAACVPSVVVVVLVVGGVVVWVVSARIAPVDAFGNDVAHW